MTVEEIEDRIRTLERDGEQRRVALDRLRTEYDQLRNQLRYPGTRFLVDLSYKLVYDATITAAASGGSGTATAGPVFETTDGQAVYVLAAHCTDSDTPLVTTHGGGTTTSADSIVVRLEHQRAGRKWEHYVAVTNFLLADHDVAVRVWRRLGMGS